MIRPPTVLAVARLDEGSDVSFAEVRRVKFRFDSVLHEIRGLEG